MAGKGEVRLSGQSARRPSPRRLAGRVRAYNLAMLDAIKALAERSVMERVVLLVNHVIAAEPAALDRLRPHAARTVQIEFAGWPRLLPALGPFAFRITPAGLVEWLGAGPGLPPDLRVAVDAGNPALAATRVVAGDRPQLVVSGDAAFASDIEWLIDNLRWDIEDDLARVVGAGPARQVARVGGWVARGVRQGAKALRDLAVGASRSDASPPRR
jgi:ubiquinone biosynthesis protein UbiJ